MTTLNLSTLNGDTWSGAVIQITLNNTVLDLSGSVIKMQLKKDTCSSAVLSLSTGAGITLLDPLNGVFQIDPQIIDVLPRKYDYDLQITLSGGYVFTPFGGTFTVEADVTN
jgi:hypothetical protein